MIRRPLVPTLALVAVCAGAALFVLRPSSRELRGDEGTYVAMSASLARDFDLEFDASDRAWAEAHGGIALILERTESGLAYSKPVLYPLLAAPWVAAAGLWGGGDWAPAAFNVAVLLAALLIARRRLGIAADPDYPEGARDALLTFAATGIVLAYLPWRMTEALQVALAIAGLALTFAAIRGRLESRSLEIGGAALLGLLVSLREPNAIVAAAPVVAALVERQPGRAARLAAAIAAAYFAVVALTVGLTGAPNPYKAPRATFNAEIGYPAGPGSAAALARFDSVDELATSTLGVAPVIDAGKSTYAALYFLVGRHTGLLWYLPATAIFFFVALRGADRPARVALASFAALALFYLVWMPVNYFGGETFLGNRYILAGAALPLVALVRAPGRRALGAAWAIAALVAGSAFVSVVRTRPLDPTSQSHANAGLFRFLPYESTASNLDGRRDRYWSGDFVRFVDPFARAESWSFVLAAGAPPAELEIATRRDVDRLHFLAHADAPDVWLEISDWGRRQRFQLAPLGDGRSGGAVEFRPSRSWRKHGFWWRSEEPYATRLVRFSAQSAGERPVEVRLRYLGRSGPPADGYGREVIRVALDGPAIAGAATNVALEVRNTGAWTWTSEAALPVQLGLRFRKLAGDGAVIEERRPLPKAVPPGELLVTTFAIDWPPEPGRYRVTLDLVLEDAAWFAEKVGEPLASAEIDVPPAARP